MEPHKTAIERAFELAKSGSCVTNSEIKQALRSEGYGEAQITGPALMRQLRAIMDANRK